MLEEPRSKLRIAHRCALARDSLSSSFSASAKRVIVSEEEGKYFFLIFLFFFNFLEFLEFSGIHSYFNYYHIIYHSYYQTVIIDYYHLAETFLANMERELRFQRCSFFFDFQDFIDLSLLFLLLLLPLYSLVFLIGFTGQCDENVEMVVASTSNLVQHGKK